MADPIQHVVLFRFPRPLTDGEARTFLGHVAAWPSRMDIRFTALRAGRDVSGRARGHEFALVTEFESPADLAAYQADPAHQEFVAWSRGLGGETLAFDFPLTSDTRFEP